MKSLGIRLLIFLNDSTLSFTARPCSTLTRLAYICHKQKYSNSAISMFYWVVPIMIHTPLTEELFTIQKGGGESSKECLKFDCVPTGQIAGTPPALIMKIYARTKKENVLEREGRAIVIL